MMTKATHVLTLAAALLSLGCSKSDQAAADDAVLAAKSEATLDSAAAAAAATAPSGTMAPEGAAAAAARGSTPARSGAATASRTSGDPPGAAAASAAAAAQPVAPAVKSSAAAGAEVAAVPATPEAKAAPAAVVPAPAATASAADPLAGKLPYEENCRKCHGAIGVPPRSMKTKFPKLANFDAEFFARRTDDSVVMVLTKGTTQDMPSFKDRLSVKEMQAVAAYIRTFGRPR